MDESQRFWAKVSVGDCWEWTAAKTTDGYGVFRAANGKHVKAHRWAYEHLVGPIPDGLTVDHLCRVRACINPDHVELVPTRTNTLRGYSAPAQARRRVTCKKGHPFVQGKTQRICRVCQNEYSNAWRAARRRAAGVPVGRSAWTSRTECPKGHPYDEANTIRTKEGYRNCRECQRIANREAKRRNREARQALTGTP